MRGFYLDKSLFLRGKDSLMGICQGGVIGHCPSLNHETRSLSVPDCGLECVSLGGQLSKGEFAG